MTSADRCTAYVMLALAFVLGWGSMLAWGTFLFFGSLNLIDLGLGARAALWFDVCLSLTFFVQHSVMVRKSFRRRVEQFLPARYRSAFYAIASGIVLLVLVLFWQESDHTLASPQGILRWLMRAIFLLAVVGFNWGTRALGGFDTFGLNPILQYLRGTDQPPPMPFTIRGPYRWVRHPLYFFCMVMFWSCPDMTTDRLIYNVLWTIWVVIGTILEERDLVSDFGETYRDYQRKVPMLIPWRIRPPVI